MASRIRKFFFKTNSSTEGKALTKLEALVSGNLRLSSSKPPSRKEKKENELTRERRVLDSSERNTTSRRKQMRSSLSPQKRYPSDLCSPCDSPDQSFCIEQKVPLLSGKTSSAPLSQCTLTGSLHQSSCESVADSLQYCAEIAPEQADICPLPVSINIQSADQPSSENNKHETYNQADSLLAQPNETVKRSEDLMKVLSHHQIEWTAMMELQKVDTTGILRGLSSRQIRWLVRESRCRTWLVGTLGPLLEERSEVINLKNVNNVDTTILDPTQDHPSNREDI